MFINKKELANQIENQVKEIISRLNSILNIHLNVGQQSIVNTSEVLMSLQSETIESLSNQTFANGAIRFSPIETNQTKSVRIQSKVEPLASFTNSANTNVSRSISFSLFDSNGNEISLDYPIEIEPVNSGIAYLLIYKFDQIPLKSFLIVQIIILILIHRLLIKNLILLQIMD